MLRIIRANENHLETLLEMRKEMLKEVNGLAADHEFDAGFLGITREFFRSGDQTTYLAYENEKAVGCATICYLSVLPTYDHPTGRRAHIMNVYTIKEERSNGLASTMLGLMIDDAKEHGVTEITLDASSDESRRIYHYAGFKETMEGMVLDLGRLLRESIERFEKNGCQSSGCQHC